METHFPVQEPIVLNQKGETLYEPKRPGAQADAGPSFRYYEVQLGKKGIFPKLILLLALLLTPVLVTAGLVFTAILVTVILTIWGLRSLLRALFLTPAPRKRSY